MTVIHYTETSANPYLHTLNCMSEQGSLYRYRCENPQSVTGLCVC